MAIKRLLSNKEQPAPKLRHKPASRASQASQASQAQALRERERTREDSSSPCAMARPASIPRAVSP